MRNDDMALRADFRSYFPREAQALEAEPTEAGIRALHRTFVQEAKQRLAVALREAGPDYADFATLAAEDLPADGHVSFLHDLYANMINATGKDVQELIDGNLAAINSVNGKDTDDAVTKKIVGGFSGSVGVACGTAVLKAMSGKGWFPKRTLQGIQTVGVKVVTESCALIRLSAIIIPPLYFAAKPAQCILYLINDVPNTITMVDSYSEHGKIDTITKMIQGTRMGKDPDDPAQSLWFGGIFSSEKRDDALIGTQNAYTFRYTEQNVEFTFGVGVSCPLTHKNALYCAFNESASAIAKGVSTDYGLSHEATFGAYRLKVSLNDTAGSPAYYIARIYKES